MKKEGIGGFRLLTLGVMLLFVFPLISAGVGISWDRESSLVPENSKTCLTYKVYNPWPDDVYTEIKVSESLQEIIKSQETDVKFIPAETSSDNAIPIEFCFKTPRVYERDCLVGDSMICKQTCDEDMRSFSGEVEAVEMSEAQFEAGGAGGSATQMSVSAPLTVRVKCVESGYNYSIVYLTIALIAGIWLAINLSQRRKKKSKKNSKKDDEKSDVEESKDSKEESKKSNKTNKSTKKK